MTASKRYFSSIHPGFFFSKNSRPLSPSPLLAIQHCVPGDPEPDDGVPVERGWGGAERAHGFIYFTCVSGRKKHN